MTNPETDPLADAEAWLRGLRTWYAAFCDDHTPCAAIDLAAACVAEARARDAEKAAALAWTDALFDLDDDNPTASETMLFQAHMATTNALHTAVAARRALMTPPPTERIPTGTEDPTGAC